MNKAMDRGSNDLESRQTGSFSRGSSAGSSFRRSLSLSRAVRLEIDDDVDSESVSEAGDTGDRSLRRRHSGNSNSRICVDNGLEQDILKTYDNWSRDPRALSTTSMPPLATKALVQSENKKQDGGRVLPQFLEYVSCLSYLSVFGILGVLTRYLLQKLFGPSVAHVTRDGSILYLDLPSNMVGSFLMGWFGVVFKEDISRVSEYLVIGLSTGYLGSLTTFSGWNQKMLDLSADGQWVYSALGFLLGLFLAAYSIIIGIETAKGFKWLLKSCNCYKSSDEENSCFRGNSFRSHMAAMLVMLLILGVLWAVSAVLLKEEFSKGSSEAQLWLGCLVGPLGVWIRWFLARLNGRGIGKGQHLKWVPFGTLIANVSAACIMAALATLKKAVDTQTCNTVASGIQLGLLGCLSTVSTFMAEFNAMRESKYPWRAYAYASFTIGVSFSFGILIYSIPVWAIGFE